MTKTMETRVTTPIHTELARRLAAPQRHRLLQGYPLRSLMRPITGDPEAWPRDSRRRLIVGVLPHAFCNPQVQGCGFCTFPQEPYHGGRARGTAERVVTEIRERTQRLGQTGRPVDALYFGGATANLTPPAQLERIAAALTESFDLSQAELTLEGVPIHFLSRRQAHLDLLAALPVRQPRISMGVQTFDPAQLEAMGRTAFGTAAQVGQVLEAARARGLTTSGDFLINLPGQSREGITADIARAIELGFDQVCVYHLVLYEGLGTPWSRDRSKLEALPDNEGAYANWRAARDLLLERGYVQTTLTNFERAEVHASPRRFRYEALSFTGADRYDGLGFGPSAISCFTAPSGREALKLINAPLADAYVEALDRTGRAYATQFAYGLRDMRLLHLTRGLSALAVPRAPYRDVLGSDPVDDFAPALTALEDAGLLTVDAEAIRLTERGAFFADSVAGLLAWRRTQALRAGQGRLPQVDPEAGPDFMG